MRTYKLTQKGRLLLERVTSPRMLYLPLEDGEVDMLKKAGSALARLCWESPMDYSEIYFDFSAECLEDKGTDPFWITYFLRNGYIQECDASVSVAEDILAYERLKKERNSREFRNGFGF